MVSPKNKVIISASRRSDIPAYHFSWFMQNINRGYLHRIHPYLGIKSKNKTSLDPADVLAIFFWTKNPAPSLDGLKILMEMDYELYFHYTINSYGQEMEPGIPALEERLQSLRSLASIIGKDRIIWRYDPIILSNKYSISWHLKEFNQLADAVCLYCQRVVISFYDPYRKSIPRMVPFGVLGGVNKSELWSKETESFVAHLAHAAKKRGLEIQSCAEDLPLNESGVKAGACIDIDLINRTQNTNYNMVKDSRQRENCLCASSVDIGIYNTCNSGCLYCYAN